MLITNGTQFNHKETSWSILGPVPYKQYHCISVRIRFAWNFMYSPRILFYTISCVKKTGLQLEHNFIDCFVKKTQKTETGLLGPEPSLCLIRMTWHLCQQVPWIQILQCQGYIPHLVGKGIPNRFTLGGWQKYSWNVLGRLCPFRKFCPKESAFHSANDKNQIFISVV